LSAYADTSFLFSVYLRDANTVRAKLLLRGLTAPLPQTAFHRLELRNAISLAVFQKRLTAAEATMAWMDVEADLRDSRLSPFLPNWASVFAKAEEVARLHTPTTGNRSLDVLHIAAAVVMGMTDFLTFDTRQALLARQLNLNVRS
jgi:predicted nucleic acid-binding protein